MMKPEQVPTGVAAVFDAVWEMTRRTDKALAAALNAWPGALHRIGIKRHKNGEWRQPYPMICLPLPQEGGDE